jgi:predicted dehydrogenase
MTIRFGVVGTGWIADAFLAGSKIAGGLTFAAVVSRSRETGLAFAQKYGVDTVFTDCLAMAESNVIDAVYIASPNSLHYEQCQLFLEHGKHVLCEKPAAVTSRELAKLQQIAKEKDLVYLEAIMMMHLPQRRLVEQALLKIGKITSARIDFSQLSSKYPKLLAGELPNIFNPQFATGCLMDLGVYCVYPAVDFFGIPARTKTSAAFLATGADGSGSSIFCYPDKEVLLSYSKVGQSRLGSEIIGDRGTLLIESISCLTGMKIVYSDGSEEPVYGSAEKAELMSGEAADFRRFIEDPDHCRMEYRICRERSLTVCRLMEEMRAEAGIRFAADEQEKGETEP